MDSLTPLLWLANTSYLQGHSFKLYKRSAQKFVRRNYFSRCIVDKWNSLLHHLVNSNSVANIKSNFDLLNLICIIMCN